MTEFSFIRAWATGSRFFSGAGLQHAILLVGVGVLLPLLLQLLLLGRPASMWGSPQPEGDSQILSVPQLAILGDFALQTVSFFASWRLGFGRGATLREALLFGLLAGPMVCAGLGLALYAVGAAFGMIGESVAALAVLVVFVALFAIAWTAFAAILAMAACVGFALSLVIGLATGNLSVGATMFGGNGLSGSILVVAALVLIWLAARLSCTPVLMSERKSLDLPAAIRESWSLTWDDEWRITRYLALLGVAVAVLLIGGLVAAGFGAGRAVGGAAGAWILHLVPIPLAYLSVLVPAGIYRELVPADVETAEVFA